MMTSERYHVPVMVEEVLDLLAPERGGLYVDGTLGGGGHAMALLERAPRAELIAFDRDPAALAEAGQRLEETAPGRVRTIRAPFSRGLASAGIAPGTLDGILLDLGVSSRQLDAGERGFSFRPGTPLDMRMDIDDHDGPAAAEWLAEADEQELSFALGRFGEVQRPARLARAIVERRAAVPLHSSDDLNRILADLIGREPTASELAPLYQALRIVVNDEIGELERALDLLPELLADGGRVVVLAYHSIEDRVVKNRFREWSRSCVCPPELPICRCRGAPLGKMLVRKPLRPSDTEVEANPRSRSARLRGWRRDR